MAGHAKPSFRAFWLLAVVSAGVLLQTACHSDAQSATSVIGGIEFGQMTTVISTDAQVYHIEVDARDQTQLLFSDGNALKETDFSSSHLLIGLPTVSGYREAVSTSARFDTILSFVQLNFTTIIAADHSNHCLRLVDRVTLRTEPFAGTCGTSGYLDGSLALFSYPTVHTDQRDSSKLLVTDYLNSAVRRVDVATGRVSTMLSVGLHRPLGLAFDHSLLKIVIGNVNYLSQYDPRTEQLSTLSGGVVSGYVDGVRGNAKFNMPKELAYLTSDTLLVADRGNRRLRVLNLASNAVHSICTSGYRTKDGTVETCSAPNPHALCVTRQSVYIGDGHSIRRLPWNVREPKKPSRDSGGGSGASSSGSHKEGHSQLLAGQGVGSGAVGGGGGGGSSGGQQSQHTLTSTEEKSGKDGDGDGDGQLPPWLIAVIVVVVLLLLVCVAAVCIKCLCGCEFCTGCCNCCRITVPASN